MLYHSKDYKLNIDYIIAQAQEVAAPINIKIG